MITLRPIERALIPSDSGAAEQLSAPNYDEFQGDGEIRDHLEARPESVLGITMAHAKAPAGEPLVDGSPAALDLAREGMEALRTSPSTLEVRDLLWIYEILDPRRPGVRQIGVGGMVSGSEIRTDANPGGSIIRNEGVRPKKARARADLIQATDAIIGIVNLGVDDLKGRVVDASIRIADSRAADLTVTDERGNRHSVWFVRDADSQATLMDLVADEPVAYVADGNHRSAAATMAGLDRFLAVLFPTGTMGIRPYNRLVAGPVPGLEELERALSESFEVRRAPEPVLSQPEQVHRIGLYVDGVAYELRARESSYDASNAVESIDADIVQRELFAAVLGIPDPGDPRLTFVGSNRDTRYLQGRVDELGGCAVALAPVTMEQFVEVCRQNRMMPPKSTWFEPKVRSGLVMALL